jgi:hypothetical protein
MDRAIEKIEKGLAKLSDNVPKYTNDDMIIAVGITTLIVSGIPVVDQWIKSYHNRKLLIEVQKRQKKEREHRQLLEQIDAIVARHVNDAVECLAVDHLDD